LLSGAVGQKSTAKHKKERRRGDCRNPQDVRSKNTLGWLSPSLQVIGRVKVNDRARAHEEGMSKKGKKENGE